MPSTEAGLITKIVNYPQYKNRAQTEAEEAARQQAAEAAAE